MSLAIVKKPSLFKVYKKRCDDVHSNLSRFHISRHNLQESTIQRKPNCPCGGGCPRCRNDLTIQPKIKINEPGDTYEQEAEAVVESETSPLLQRKCACAEGTPCHECEDEKEEPVQRKTEQASDIADISVSGKNFQNLGPGQPLDPVNIAFYKLHFGYDFRNVRLHTDEHAAESARAVYAQAYTVGRDVVFGRGQYAPWSEAGRKLLSHELTHVVQQGGKAFDLSSERANKCLQRAVIGAGVITGTGTKESEDSCAGWFSDRESTSKRAAEHYVRTELTGDRGVVEKIECDLFNPDTGAFACTVHFTDGTPIRVIVRRDVIIVGVYPLQTMHPPPDRPLCWYDYKCPGPDRDLVLTKRKCQTSKPAHGTSLPKTHGPEP
ncbi:MAG: eCIS core domain-containing protein [Candidatus Loosdrechtia sp.]|uniref:eCIS core domain-containing protein n=1 Tax=Candidatus Loosdrechtia sp. TaxID=3101272 RepID=UPI003A6BC439|nr:MAG: DUF4157 domain-containing protein [Candidatus Jettenia sp. AMX2]